jgi:hypothetical protein
MTFRDSLGEVEQLLLLAIVRLGDDAYGVTIRQEIAGRTGREVATASSAKAWWPRRCPNRRPSAAAVRAGISV